MSQNNALEIIKNLDVAFKTHNRKKARQLLECLENPALDIEPYLINLNHILFELIFDINVKKFLTFIYIQKKEKISLYFLDAACFFVLNNEKLVDKKCLKNFSDFLFFVYKKNSHFKDFIINKTLHFIQNLQIKINVDYFFDFLLIPILKELKKDNEINFLLALEVRIYGVYIKKYDTESHFSESFSKISRIYIDAGRSELQEPSPKIPTKILKLSESNLESICFFIHSASMLAHNVSMLDIFKGLVSLKNKTIRPIVFCFSKIDSTSSLSFENELRNMKIEIIYLDDFFELKNDENNILKKLSLLKEILSHYKIHKFIAVSVCVWLNFIFSMQIAPIQIYLSLKYHSFNHPKIDFYITPGTFGEKFRLINGIKWLTYPPSLSNLFDPKLTVHAKEIKTQLGQNKVIISCIAREEKLRNFNYLKLIASILKKCPEAIFLWAGRTNDLFISNFFNDNNLNSQVIFIGWVDTRLYAQVIDIFLDCFPQPAGHTLYQAMAAGVPFVTSLLSDQNMGIQSSINNMILLKFEEGKIESIFNLDTARPLYLLAKDEDEYIELAIKLIRDESFRVDVGNAGRKFVQEYLSDIKKSAESFQNIISKFI